ncbi:hypothetical protein Tco_0432228 [Tanacetum coccineum]
MPISSNNIGRKNSWRPVNDVASQPLYSVHFVSLLLSKTRTFALGFVVSHDHEEVEIVLSSSFERVDNEQWELWIELFLLLTKKVQGKRENEVEAGFRRCGTGQNVSAKSFSGLECLVFTDSGD